MRLVLGVRVPELLEDGVLYELGQLLHGLDDAVGQLALALERGGDQLAAAEADVVGRGLRPETEGRFF